MHPCLYTDSFITLDPTYLWHGTDEMGNSLGESHEHCSATLLTVLFLGNTGLWGLSDCEFTPNQHGFGGTGRRGIPTHVVLADTPRTSTVPGCLHMGTRVLATFNMVAFRLRACSQSTWARGLGRTWRTNPCHPGGHSSHLAGMSTCFFFFTMYSFLFFCGLAQLGLGKGDVPWKDQSVHFFFTILYVVFLFPLVYCAVCLFCFHLYIVQFVRIQ